MCQKDILNFEKERNKILKNISDNYAFDIKKKNNNNKNKWDMLAIIISVIAIVISIVMPIYIYKKELFNKSLLLSGDIEIIMNDQDTSDYTIKFSIKQGGIKKAYISTISSNGSIIYNDILQYSDGSVITLARDSEKNKETIQDDDIRQSSLDESIMKNEIIEGDKRIEINTIEDFALILLDTTDQWWIYYFISTPEFIPNDSEYCLEVYSENGDVIASFKKELEVQEMNRIIIDGSLTSVASIEEEMKELKVDYYLFNMPQDFEGVNGEIFTSNPRIENVYELPSAADIYNNIQKIREDIKGLSF